MLSLVDRILIGPAALCASGLAADVAGLDRPARPPAWTPALEKPALKNPTALKPQADRAQPFFNHLATHTGAAFAD